MGGNYTFNFISIKILDKKWWKNNKKFHLSANCQFLEFIEKHSIITNVFWFLTLKKKYVFCPIQNNFKYVEPSWFFSIYCNFYTFYYCLLHNYYLILKIRTQKSTLNFSILNILLIKIFQKYINRVLSFFCFTKASK